MLFECMAEWGFYGRRSELDELTQVLDKRRFFFMRVSGRRRIGKTTLVQQALQKTGRQQVFYVQIPDSGPAGVLSAVRDGIETFQIDRVRFPPPIDLNGLARFFADLARSGYVVAVDEFQYFARKQLYEFCSFLQAEIDRLMAHADEVEGGLIVLGSLHAEMEALLENRAAPLYNRTTHDLQLQHLDIATIIEILRAHASPAPERLLFLWNLFEGVPKFYRDCFEQNALGSERIDLIVRMFFGSSSPLRNEADNWFLKELRGRYDVLLKYIARHPGCSHADLIAYVREVSPLSQEQVSGYLQALEERFMMIENRQPFSVKPQSRRRRYYVSDNFLRCWLAAIAPEIAAVNFRPLPELVSNANRRLFDAEGSGLEKLVRIIYEERSRKGRGDLQLSQSAAGYWDKAEIEIDVVAVDETQRVLRLLTCKRSADKLTTDHLVSYDKHINGFLKRHPAYQQWTVQKYAVAPRLELAHRQAVRSAGYTPEDLEDLCDGL